MRAYKIQIEASDKDEVFGGEENIADRLTDEIEFTGLSVDVITVTEVK